MVVNNDEPALAYPQNFSELKESNPESLILVYHVLALILSPDNIHRGFDMLEEWVEEDTRFMRHLTFSCIPMFLGGILCLVLSLLFHIKGASQIALFMVMLAGILAITISVLLYWKAISNPQRKILHTASKLPMENQIYNRVGDVIEFVRAQDKKNMSPWRVMIPKVQHLSS